MNHSSKRYCSPMRRVRTSCGDIHFRGLRLSSRQQRHVHIPWLYKSEACSHGQTDYDKEIFINVSAIPREMSNPVSTHRLDCPMFCTSEELV
jgi:hypothetical protein